MTKNTTKRKQRAKFKIKVVYTATSTPDSAARLGRVISLLLRRNGVKDMKMPAKDQKEGGGKLD